MKPQDAIERNLRAPKVESAPPVLHIIDNLQVGGAQSLLITMSSPCEPLLKMRVVDLAGLDTIVSTALADAGIEIRKVGVRRLSSFGGWSALFWQLKTAHEPIVHLHLSYATVMAAPLSKLLRKKVVVTLHNIDRPKRRNLPRKLVRYLETFCLRHFVDCVIAVGDEVLTTNRRRIGAFHVETLLNVIAPPSRIDTASRRQMRHELGAHSGDVVILATGRLNPQKDHLSLLSAFAQVLATFPNAALWIAGDGSLRRRLEEAADLLGIQRNVNFLGRRSDVPALIDAADIFVLSSAWEGFPVALIEAMAGGLVPVATTVGDVPRVITNFENGLLVEPQNPRQLANALLELCKDTKLRRNLAKNAETSVRKLTDVSGWKRAILAIYEKVL